MRSLKLGAVGWAIADGLVSFLAIYAAFVFSPSFDFAAEYVQTGHITPIHGGLLFTLLAVASAHVFGLHDPLLVRQFWPTLTRCLGATLLSVALLSGVVFGLLFGRIGRYILIQTSVITPILMTTVRSAAWKVSSKHRRRILLVGAKRTRESVSERLRTSGLPLEIVAHVDRPFESYGASARSDAAADENLSLGARCVDLQVDEVVVCTAGKFDDQTLDELMDCLNRGTKVSNCPQFVERNFYQVPVEYIHSDWFLHADLEVNHPIYTAVRRITDIAAAFLGIILSGPLVVLAVIAIKLESRGPALYSQVRTGYLNTKFRIWKLRTMHHDAEQDGPQWALAKDMRVTRVGWILRKSRMDELPQFWNILKGEMSLVGPRPERPEFTEQLGKKIPFYQQRNLVKPGLTGWAQINYPYGASFQDSLNKLEYDLYYVKYASVGLDFQIILRTIGVIMKGSR